MCERERERDRLFGVTVDRVLALQKNSKIVVLETALDICTWEVGLGKLWLLVSFLHFTLVTQLVEPAPHAA